MDAPRFKGSDGGTSPQTCSTAEWNTTPQEQEAYCPSHDPDRRDGHTAIGHSPDVRVAVTKIQAQTSRSVLPVNGGAEPLTPVLVSQPNKAAKQRDDATICTVTSAPPPSIRAVTFASHCLEEEQQQLGSCVNTWGVGSCREMMRGHAG